MHIPRVISRKQDELDSESRLPFEIRAASALGISVVADALDYVGAPIFALPVIGDVADGIVMALLYRLTGSKKSAAINAIEFIPFIGDYVPTYTITTLAWILKKMRRGNALKSRKQLLPSFTTNYDNIRTSSGMIPDDNTTKDGSNDLRTRLMRAYAVLRSNSANTA